MYRTVKITVRLQWLHSGYTVATQWLHSGYTVATQWLHSGYTVTCTVLFSTLPVDLHCNSCNIGRILQLYSHESCCNIGRILQLLQPRDKCTVLLQPRDKCSHGSALPHAAKNREARRSTCVGGAGARTASGRINRASRRYDARSKRIAPISCRQTPVSCRQTPISCRQTPVCWPRSDRARVFRSSWALGLGTTTDSRAQIHCAH